MRICSKLILERGIDLLMIYVFLMLCYCVLMISLDFLVGVYCYKYDCCYAWDDYPNRFRDEHELELSP